QDDDSGRTQDPDSGNDDAGKTDGKRETAGPTTKPSESGGAAEAKRVVPTNTAGFCDPELQSVIDSMLTGETSLRQGLAKVEPELWDHMVSIPLFQLADTLAVGSGVSGVTAGPPLVGPFSSAVNWTRAPR
ncbi:MAG: ABC transporter family substrate-binding protein, partial [Saccharomonospora viridis]